MSFSPAIENIDNAQQGNTFDEVWTWETETTASDGTVSKTPVDLTGYSARLQVRKDGIEAPLIDIRDGNGITLGGAAGTIAINITAAIMASVPATTGEYDLEMTANDANGVQTVRKLMQGTFTIQPEVTRP